MFFLSMNTLCQIFFPCLIVYLLYVTFMASHKFNNITFLNATFLSQNIRNDLQQNLQTLPSLAVTNPSHIGPRGLQNTNFLLHKTTVVLPMQLKNQYTVKSRT